MFSKVLNPIITDKKTGEVKKDNSPQTNAEGEVISGYYEGEIHLDLSDLPEWSKEDLAAFAEWLEAQLIHYGPTATYKSQHGIPEKLVSADGRYLCDGSVFRVNPKWRPNQMTEEVFAKKLAFNESFLGRKLTDKELAEARINVGLPAKAPKS